MANSKLYNKTYRVPSNVLKRINSVLVSNPHGDGVKRAKNILKSGSITYQGMKRLKNFFDYNDQKKDKAQYELSGGDLMKSFIERTLNADRDGVKRSDDIKKDLNVDVNLGTHATQSPRLNEDVINEIGETLVDPYQYRENYFDLGVYYYFETEDGDKYVVRFFDLGAVQQNKSSQNTYTLEFATNGEQGHVNIVNKGRSYKVISTIIHIVKEFMDRKNPKRISFSPVSNFPNDERRKNMFLNYLKKQIPPTHKYSISFWDKNKINIDRRKDNVNESVGDKKIKKNSTAVIVGKDNRFLLVKRSSYADQWMPNKWSLVGGSVEKGENPENAIKREILEECGLEIKDMVDTFTIQRDNVMEYVFACRYDGDPMDVELNEEHDGYGWFSLPEINYLDTVPHLIEYLTLVFKKYE